MACSSYFSLGTYSSASHYHQYPIIPDTVPSSHTVCCHRRPQFYKCPQISRLLDLNTYKDISNQMNPTISKYPRCHLLEMWDLRLFSSARTSSPTILYTKYNRKVKSCRISRQKSRYFDFFYFSFLSITFSGVSLLYLAT